MGLLAVLTRGRAAAFAVTVVLFMLVPASPALASTGAITGTVTAHTGGADLQNVEVDVYDTTGNFINSACTQSNGTYNVGGLATGSYIVQFVANGTGSGFCGTPQDYASQYYNDQSSFGSANAVSVTDGVTTSGIDAALLNGAHISGTVTAFTGGANLQNILVDAFDSTGNFAGYACTASNGTYTLTGLAADSTGYTVEFSASGGFTPCGAPQNYVTQYYNDQSSYGSANPVPVTPGGSVTGIDASMHTGGQITGTVTAATGGADLQNVEVDVFDTSGNFVTAACTASNGTYTVVGLPTASYVVQFVANGTGVGSGCSGTQDYGSQYYNDQATFASANQVTVTAGSTTSGINAALANGGHITGTVTDASTGSPLASIDVVIYDSSGNPLSGTCTDSTGGYEFTGLAAGSYQVSFDRYGFCGGPSGYQSQFYRYESAQSAADPVSVTAGATTSGIDGALAPAGTHVLAVSSAGAGSGNVSSSPAGIACPSTCVHTFTSGSAVTLTATPAAGSTFSGWSGAGCSGTGTCTVTMSADKSVTASFAPTPPPGAHTLTVSRAGSGSGSVSSSPAGISCPSTCAHAFTSGSAVTLTATAAAGSTFSGWSGSGCSGTGTCTVTMSADMAATATFTAKPAPPPAPSCTVKPKSARVLLKAKKGNAGSKSKVGRLYVSVTCNQTASVKLASKLTEKLVIKGKKHTKTFSLGAVKGTASADKALVLSVRVPLGALKALKHAHESVAFVLAAKNANGTSRQTASIASLHGI